MPDKKDSRFDDSKLTSAKVVCSISGQLGVISKPIFMRPNPG